MNRMIPVSHLCIGLSDTLLNTPSHPRLLVLLIPTVALVNAWTISAETLAGDFLTSGLMLLLQTSPAITAVALGNLPTAH